MFKLLAFYNNRKRILSAFPREKKKEIVHVLKILDINAKYGISQETYSVRLHGESLYIPYRIYFNEPNEQALINLSVEEKIVLSCIFTRHHNGFIREKHIKLLLSHCDKKYIAPYIFHILGEYVAELIDIIDKNIPERGIMLLKCFQEENTTYASKIKSKLISYWNEYYRYPDMNIPQSKFYAEKYQDYIGYKLYKRIFLTSLN